MRHARSLGFEALHRFVCLIDVSGLSSQGPLDLYMHSWLRWAVPWSWFWLWFWLLLVCSVLLVVFRFLLLLLLMLVVAAEFMLTVWW